MRHWQVFNSDLQTVHPFSHFILRGKLFNLGAKAAKAQSPFDLILDIIMQFIET